jgi:hypothetical protein
LFKNRIVQTPTRGAPWSGREEAAMLRDQMIGFMQTAIVFLLLTTAISVLVALYAMKTANMLVRPGEAKRPIERKLEAILSR